MNSIIKSSEIVFDAIHEELYSNSNVLVLSHSNCFSVNGGIERCVRREHDIARNKGVKVLYIFPLRTPGKIFKEICGVYYDATFMGYCFFDGLVHQFRKTNFEYTVIHSVVHFDHNALLRLLLTMRKRCPVMLWLHDLSYVCDSHVLLRNNLFCGVPHITDPKCLGCDYQPTRVDLNDFYCRLISYVRFIVVPSRAAMDRFIAYFDADVGVVRKIKIIPHYYLSCQASTLKEVTSSSEKIGIAFFGHNVHHKGWPLYATLVDTLYSTGRYCFYHVGTQHASDKRIQYIPYSELSADEYGNRLQYICQSNNINIGFFWSTTLESFGLMYRQVLATQCAVLARGDDPVLREFIEGCDKIRFFDHFDELINFFCDTTLVDDLLLSSERITCTLKESKYSFEILANCSDIH